MLQSRRRRRFGSVISTPSTGQGGRRIAPFIFVGLIAVIGVWIFIRFLTPTADMRRVATILSTDGRGQVDVTISGEDTAQRAETGLKLYEGDRVRTDSVSYATLRFFDGSAVTLDQGSAVRIEESLQGTESSRISIVLEGGRIFVESGTGTLVERSVETTFGIHLVPPRTQVILGGEMDTSAEKREVVAVFETTGPGMESFIRVGRQRANVITGEGQQLVLTTSALALLQENDGDPYSLRQVLDAGLSTSPFFLYLLGRENEPVPEENSSSPGTPPEQAGDSALLVIEEPADGSLLEGEAVIVRGKIGSQIVQVRVNGYAAEIANGTYQKEIALPAEEEFSVDVQAEDKDGLIVATKSITLRRDIKPPEPPVITQPARRTLQDMSAVPPPGAVSVQEDEFEIVGEALGDAVGIIVNGYRLQKFTPGKPWAYLVDSDLGNVRVGENTYEAVAVDRSGNKSEPVRIVILWKAEAVPETPDGELPPDDGKYLFPGSLRVIAPTADGSAYVTSEPEVLIEGETHPDTYSISINGFSLTLYEPGKVTWNYIAKEEFGNYKQGVNRYAVVARNSAGKILDVLRYVIEKR